MYATMRNTLREEMFTTPQERAENAVGDLHRLIRAYKGKSNITARTMRSPLLAATSTSEAVTNSTLSANLLERNPGLYEHIEAHLLEWMKNGGDTDSIIANLRTALKSEGIALA